MPAATKTPDKPLHVKLWREATRPLRQLTRQVAPAGSAFSSSETLASCKQVQNQAQLNGIRRLAGFDAVYSAPAELRMPERVAIYSLVFGLQPQRSLEIGSFRGGSTAIIHAALSDTGKGHLWCVDPDPKIDPELWAHLSDRCRMFQGFSPHVLKAVAADAGGAFDFAFIDGNHAYEDLREDIRGVLPLMSDGAHLLFHDALHDSVRRAIADAVSTHPELVDCGMVSVEPTVLQQGGREEIWAGLHLLRCRR